MGDIRFIETVTRQLLSSIREDGSIPPESLKILVNCSDQELTSIRNCFRVMTGKISSAPRGQDLILQAVSAAEKNKDPALTKLVKRLSYLARNDKKVEMGLRGAIHCFSHALNKKAEE